MKNYTQLFSNTPASPSYGCLTTQPPSATIPPCEEYSINIINNATNINLSYENVIYSNGDAINVTSTLTARDIDISIEYETSEGNLWILDHDSQITVSEISTPSTMIQSIQIFPYSASKGYVRIKGSQSLVCDNVNIEFNGTAATTTTTTCAPCLGSISITNDAENTLLKYWPSSPYFEIPKNQSFSIAKSVCDNDGTKGNFGFNEAVNGWHFYSRFEFQVANSSYAFYIQPYVVLDSLFIRERIKFLVTMNSDRKRGSVAIYVSDTEVANCFANIDGLTFLFSATPQVTTTTPAPPPTTLPPACTTPIPCNDGERYQIGYVSTGTYAGCPIYSDCITTTTTPAPSTPSLSLSITSDAQDTKFSSSSFTRQHVQFLDNLSRPIDYVSAPYAQKVDNDKIIRPLVAIGSLLYHPPNVDQYYISNASSIIARLKNNRHLFISADSLVAGRFIDSNRNALAEYDSSYGGRVLSGSIFYADQLTSDAERVLLDNFHRNSTNTAQFYKYLKPLSNIPFQLTVAQQSYLYADNQIIHAIYVGRFLYVIDSQTILTTVDYISTVKLENSIPSNKQIRSTDLVVLKDGANGYYNASTVSAGGPIINMEEPSANDFGRYTATVAESYINYNDFGGFDLIDCDYKEYAYSSNDIAMSLQNSVSTQQHFFLTPKNSIMSYQFSFKINSESFDISFRWNDISSFFSIDDRTISSSRLNNLSFGFDAIQISNDSYLLAITGVSSGGGGGQQYFTKTNLFLVQVGQQGEGVVTSVRKIRESTSRTYFRVMYGPIFPHGRLDLFSITNEGKIGFTFPFPYEYLYNGMEKRQGKIEVLNISVAMN